MPVPMWVARVNRKVFNPREIAKGARPVLGHVGRVSGRAHRTPLDAHEVEGGYVFIVMYGRKSDWVRNVMESGTATLEVGGATIDLSAPRFVTPDEAWALLGDSTKRPAGFLNVSDYLFMESDGRRSHDTKPRRASEPL